MSWYKQCYVNRRDWIISHLSSLDLSTDEVVLLLYIDLCNSNNIPIDGNAFATTLNMSQEAIDKAIASLVNSKRLTITYPNGSLIYNIDGVFTYENPSIESMDTPLLSIIEQQFGRKLSVSEIRKLANMRECYDDDTLEQALREALFHKKYSLDYVNAICVNWKGNK